jgi:hypothetical protein
VNPDYTEWNVAAQLPEVTGERSGSPGEERAPRAEERAGTAGGLTSPRRVLTFYRRLFALRRESEVLRRGSITFDTLSKQRSGDSDTGPVVGYTRAFGEDRLQVVVNLSSEEVSLEGALEGALGGAFRHGTLLLSNYPPPHCCNTGRAPGALRPWELCVFEEQR